MLVTFVRQCDAITMVLVAGLSLLLAIRYVLPVVDVSSIPAPVGGGDDDYSTNSYEEDGYLPTVDVPFILIRDTVAFPAGGLGRKSQKPVERVLHVTLEGYHTEMSQALSGMSQMLERALELEEVAFLRRSSDGLNDGGGGRSASGVPPPSVRLSARIEERIRRSSVCLEEDERLLHRLLGSFPYVLALPDGVVRDQVGDDQSSDDVTSHHDDGAPPAELSVDGEERGPCPVQRRFEDYHSPHNKLDGALGRSPPPTLFRMGSSDDHRAMLELEFHSYDSASQIVAHIVRDWTKTGRPIRRSLYDWCCIQVETFLPPTRWNRRTDVDGGATLSSRRGESLSILVPGAGMGRLAYELCQRGHHVEANELSPSMAAAACAILQRRVSGSLHPFVLDAMANEVDSSRRYDAVSFPDIDLQPRSLGKNEPRSNGSLSYTVGNFVGSTGDDSYYRTRSGHFDAVVTCFFIDTASNLYEYIDMIGALVKPGVGVWINVGPVQWHQYAQLRPSVDELKDLLLAVGWSIKLWSVDRMPVSYRESDDGYLRTTNYDGYRPLRFVAIRSNGVY